MGAPREPKDIRLVRALTDVRRSMRRALEQPMPNYRRIELLEARARALRLALVMRDWWPVAA